MPDEPPPTLDLDRMLLDFVHGRDVACPQCGYNLRNLTTTTCPECKQALKMQVGVQRPPLLPFVLAIAPGIFGGLCAAVLVVMFSANFIANGGRLVGFPWQIALLDGFGWLSGLCTIGLVVGRHRFLAAPVPRQRAIAAAIWIGNILAVVLVLVLAMVFG